MLRPDYNSDRLNYSDMLLPPPGYRLNMAVGTTYSLDLETLTAINIALGIQQDVDNKLMNKNPIILLKSLQSVIDKVVIFCEDGQIKFPAKKNKLALILEKMIVPIALPRNNNSKYYPAFHSKTWTIEYVSKDGDKIYKFIVLSRNMTFDRSWDVAFSITGAPADYEEEKSRPISDFLSFLKTNIKKESCNYANKTKLLNTLKKNIIHTHFCLDSSDFNDFSILPLGIGSKSCNVKKSPLFNESFDDMVIMSPFLSETTIQKLNNPNNSFSQRALFTRKSELSKLTSNVFSSFNVYTLRDEIIDGENGLSEDDDRDDRLDSEIRQQDIHAKIIMRCKGHKTYLYLGSANATEAAFNSNVELGVKLICKDNTLDYKKLTASFFCGDEYGNNNPFVKVTSAKKDEEIEVAEEKMLEQRLKDICRIEKSAYIEKVNDRFNINVCFSSVPDFECYLSPISLDKECRISENMVFQDLELIQLSEMYSIRIVGKNTEIRRVILINTANIPEDRDSAVINKVIENKRAFIEYIAYSLDDDFIISALQNEQTKESGVYRESPDLMPALYEKMLKASSENPSKLAEIEYVINMISDEEIVTKEFRQTYETFKKTLKIK